MLKLCLVQLKKLFFRTDVKWILAVMLLLPFGIAFLISIESGIVQIGDSVFTAMGYSSVLIGLLSSLLLISVIMALITTSFLSKEIDIGLDCVYAARTKSRSQLILSKMIALDILSITIFITLLISAIVGWVVFLKCSAFGVDAFWSENRDRDEIFLVVYTVIGSFFETLVLVRLFTLFSLMFKYGKAVIFNFVIIVLFKLLANVEKLQLWIPSYIGSGTHLAQYTGAELIHKGILSIGLLAGYVAVISVVNYLLYKKMDLAR